MKVHVTILLTRQYMEFFYAVLTTRPCAVQDSDSP